VTSRLGGFREREGQCWDCGGPCLDYKGNEHGWRCTNCLDRYLDTGWANWLTLSDKERARRTQGFRPGGGDRGGTDPKGRRGGGGLASGRTAPTTTAGVRS